MKKIIAIMLSAFMLLGVMVTTSFASDFDPWDLADFGQKSWTIEVSDKAPVIDGKIEDGEYAVAEKDLSVADDASDDRLFIVDRPDESITFDVYMSCDEDRFYLGVTITGPEIITEVGPNGTVDSRLIAILGCDKNNYNRNKMLKLEVKPDDVSANNVDEMVAVVDGKTVTYELAVRKNTMLDQYGIDEFEQLYIMLLITDVTEESLENPELWNEVYFGYKTSELKEIFPDGSPRYCHVIFFEEAEETEAPETEAPSGQDAETEAPSTEAPVTEAPETEAPVAEGGCGASVAAVGVAIVAMLGTCTAVVSKKDN